MVHGITLEDVLWIRTADSKVSRSVIVNRLKIVRDVLREATNRSGRSMENVDSFIADERWEDRLPPTGNDNARRYPRWLRVAARIIYYHGLSNNSERRRMLAAIEKHEKKPEGAGREPSREVQDIEKPLDPPADPMLKFCWQFQAFYDLMRRKPAQQTRSPSLQVQTRKQVAKIGILKAFPAQRRYLINVLLPHLAELKLDGKLGPKQCNDMVMGFIARVRQHKGNYPDFSSELDDESLEALRNAGRKVSRTKRWPPTVHRKEPPADVKEPDVQSSSDDDDDDDSSSDSE